MSGTSDKTVEKLAMNVVNQLFDEVRGFISKDQRNDFVDWRQKHNDECINFVKKLMYQASEAVEQPEGTQLLASGATEVRWQFRKMLARIRAWICIELREGEVIPSWYYGLGYIDFITNTERFYPIPLNYFIRLKRRIALRWDRFRAKPTYVDRMILKAESQISEKERNYWKRHYERRLKNDKEIIMAIANDNEWSEKIKQLKSKIAT